MNDTSLDHQQVWELLPWIANGTASAEQFRAADLHLRDCAACRGALARERTLAAGMGLPAERAPQAELGLQRLMNRLDQPQAGEKRFGAASAFTRRGLRGASAVLLGVGAIELVALAALAMAGWTLHATPPAPQAAASPYQTLSKPQPAAAQARLRLVFDTKRPVAELSAMLREQQLQIVAGPTPAGVWSLAPATPGAVDAGAVDADAVAHRLRQWPGVLFAEALAPVESP